MVLGLDRAAMMSSVSATHSESRMADLEGKADVDLPLPKDYWEQNTTSAMFVNIMKLEQTQSKEKEK